MLSKLFFGLLLVAVWCIWSGIFTPLFLSFCLIAGVLVVLFVERLDGVDSEHYRHYIRFHALRYWPWLFKEMLVSSLRVARKVWTPTPDLSPTFAWLPSNQKTDEARVYYANSITLTPGTVSCDVDGGRILVHALEARSIDELKEDRMGQFIARSYDRP